MEERPYETANVDVCTSCYGVWVEWFDGDIPAIAASAPPPSRPSSPGASVSTWRCPACQQALVEEEVFGATIGRCGECAGAYLARGAIDAVAELARNPPPSSEPQPQSQRSLFDRLVALVRAVFVA